MNRIAYLLFLILPFILDGCQMYATSSISTLSPKSISTASSIPVESPTGHSTPDLSLRTQMPIPSPTIRSTVTLTPIDAPLQTQTPMIPPQARLKFQCIDVVSAKQNIFSNGVVVLANRQVVDDRYKPDDILLDMATGTFTQLGSINIYSGNYSVSPNFQLLAFRNIVFNTTMEVVKEELVVANGTGKILKIVPWQYGWSQITDWLDNERLVINIASLDPDESHARKAASLLVLNPFTGERKVLQPDFPQIYNYYPIPNWDDWGITVYDSTLKRVVYLRINEKGEYVNSIFDIEKNQILVNLISGFDVPRWSPDASRVVMANLPQGKDYIPFGTNHFETLLVSRDGAIEQLTQLGTYTDMNLSGYSWSPDGRYIAAWLESPSLRNEKEVELAIVDTTNREITSYCIRMKYGGEGYGGHPKAPIWSPDGKQLLLMDWYEPEHRRVIQVDTIRGLAAPIADDMEPMGWMLTP